MTERDYEEFHTCDCRVRRNESQCPIHDPLEDSPEPLLDWDAKTLDIPIGQVPEWVDRIDEFKNL